MLDSYSRYIVHAELLPTMTAGDGKKVLDRALAGEGLITAANKPVFVSDNGTQLVSKSFKKGQPPGCFCRGGGAGQGR
ncbi:helix-turn-helix domain protein [Calderihabitans maritimus]|uniref:Helix-turn-helix domain protein, partial n=1 Tax=Calderihabitans maritimus TaxID=1246530 RepID=A0A1Z5HTJ4_9FIRM|nr:helix-turn-helix domain protein [Calderihabitans maritimus]